ncbi:MAG: aldo/keto reductase [Acholeplasmatales bacterium]|nr:aldo/keto reductase [Acholeplasmatales bacterium]
MNKTIKLNNNMDMPVLALGTWLMTNEEARLSVIEAVKLGYRFIDTAEGYQNEEGVGLGLKECGVPREEIFLQTKLKAEIKNYDDAKREIELSFKKLDVDYIDSVIIHWPTPWELRNGNVRFEKENLEVWRALSEYVKEGRIRTIGLSNFWASDVKNILDNAEIKPTVNQIKVHIGETPLDLINYCKENNIVVQAYSPIAHGKLLNNEMVAKMAAKYNVSISQLCIRYTLQLGLVSIPKTTHPEYMKMNMNVDFVISDEDMEILKSIKL